MDLRFLDVWMPACFPPAHFPFLHQYRHLPLPVFILLLLLPVFQIVQFLSALLFPELLLKLH